MGGQEESFSSNNGVALIDQLCHLQGDRDLLAQIGSIMFPKRWPIMSWSSWNLAKAEGRVQLIPLGPVSHNGATGPLDAIAQLPNGTPHLSQTLALMMNILTGQYVPPTPLTREPHSVAH